MVSNTNINLEMIGRFQEIIIFIKAIMSLVFFPLVLDVYKVLIYVHRTNFLEFSPDPCYIIDIKGTTAHKGLAQ